MKKLSLTTGERFCALNILNEQKGTLETINLALKTIDKVSLTEEEIKKVGLKRSATTITWEDPKFEVELEFSDDQYKNLKTAFEARDKRADWTMQEGGSALLLKEKFAKVDEVEKKAEEKK